MSQASLNWAILIVFTQATICFALETTKLGGGFKYSLCSSLFGEDSHFD